MAVERDRAWWFSVTSYAVFILGPFGFLFALAIRRGHGHTLVVTALVYAALFASQLVLWRRRAHRRRRRSA